MKSKESHRKNSKFQIYMQTIQPNTVAPVPMGLEAAATFSKVQQEVRHLYHCLLQNCCESH